MKNEHKGVRGSGGSHESVLSFGRQTRTSKTGNLSGSGKRFLAQLCLLVFPFAVLVSYGKNNGEKNEDGISPPPASHAPGVLVMKRPFLTRGAIVIQDPSAHLRDPSAIHFWEGEWHCYVTRVPLSLGLRQPLGYRGSVWHYAAPRVEGPWTDRGEVVPHGTEPAAFDSLGTFTADIIREPQDGRYYLFYSGCRIGFTNEFIVNKFGPWEIGMCVADSPNGPFRRSPRNPILAVHGPKTQCLGMRLDEAHPLIIDGKRRLYFRGTRLVTSDPFQVQKCICLATPTAGNWEDAYQPSGQNPLVVPPEKMQCHESYAYFPGPDGLLHALSISGWKWNVYRNILFHFVFKDGVAWRFDGKLKMPVVPEAGDMVPSPHVVWSPDSVPGDRGKVIGFVTQCQVEGTRVGIRLLNLAWLDSPIAPTE